MIRASKNKYRVLICDDESSFQSQLKKELSALGGNLQVETFADLAGGDEEAARKYILEQVAILEQRRSDARRSNTRDKNNSKSDFDDTDILIIDYDLIQLDKSTYLTGEAVAYLARCYSSCNVIIGLDQFRSNVFDLTLKDKLESYADLNVGAIHLASSSLWESSPSKLKSAFKSSREKLRPWSWPILPRQVENFRRCVEDLSGHLDEPILPFLGFKRELIDALPRSILEFIDVGPGTAPHEITFSHFLTRTSNGFRTPKDAEYPWTGKLARERIAAARISRWLEGVVLPEQDILVDAPHLVTRYPSLLTGNPSKLSTWNKTASREEPPNLGINHSVINDFRFPRHHWLSRPAWLWKDLQTHTAIDEVKNPWEAKSYDYAFCEDTSRFVSLKDATEFVADLSSPFARRHVERLNTINYNPGIRFSL